MIRNLVFLAAILGCTISAPITTEKELMNFFERQPDVGKDLLTPKEQAAVVQLFIGKKITSNEEAISTLKLKLPAIYAKMEKVITEQVRKLEALPVKAKEFIKYTEGKKGEVEHYKTETEFDKYIVEVLNEYDTLSAQDVEALKKYNPTFDYLYGDNFYRV